MTPLPTHLIINADGGSRDNPGPAATGFIIRSQSGQLIHQQGNYLGLTTNNVAEYQAVHHALKWLKDNLTPKPNTKVDFYLDSNLVVNQLNGQFKIKQPHLREIFVHIKFLESELQLITSYHHIPREQNSQADSLLNQALDLHQR